MHFLLIFLQFKPGPVIAHKAICVHQMFIEHLPCARGQGYFGLQDRQAPCPHEALCLEGETKIKNCLYVLNLKPCAKAGEM